MSATNTLPPRRAGLRGLRQESHAPELMLARFKDVAAAPPPEGDVTQGRTDWGIDHNDTFGCCGPAATDHFVMAKIGPSAQPDQLGGRGVLPLYFAYGKSIGEPGDQPDQGVENATWLKFLFDQGIIEGYAELNKNDPVEIHQAMLDFKGCLVAVSLTDDAEQLFEQHQPWTTAQGEQPDPNMGHDILLVRYGPEGMTFVTWGGLQMSTIPWDHVCILEVWVIMTKEDAARAGVNFTALQNEIRNWGGTQVQPVPSAPGLGPTEHLLQRIGRVFKRVWDDIRRSFVSWPSTRVT